MANGIANAIRLAQEAARRAQEQARRAQQQAQRPANSGHGTGVVSNGGGGVTTVAPTYTGGGGGGYGGGGYGGGGYGGGGGAGVAAYSAPAAPEPPAPPRMSDDDWLKQDTGYQATLKALDSKMKSYETENTATRSKGIQDYDTSLTRLGWINGKDGAEGTWNKDDRTTSYGNAYQGQLGDFASRGMLQSSLYDQALTDMLGEYSRQKTDMDKNHNDWLSELQRALTSQKDDTEQGKSQARIEALARRVAQETGA